MKRTTIGVDIAKQVFEIYVEDGGTRVMERKRLSRKKMLLWFANRERLEPSALVVSKPTKTVGSDSPCARLIP